ncbi:MAG: hypothetical protein QME42_01970 [bacterium]|nr:hypothetical protein [bacterium]
MSSLKKVIGSLVVFGLIIGGVGVLQVMGGKPQKTEVKAKNERLKPKIQRQVGTPTVQQLLDKVEANYHKIKDLKADGKVKLVLTEEDDMIKKVLGIIGNLFIVNEKFYFKAPDKLKWSPPNPVQTAIVKNQVKYSRMIGPLGEVVNKDTPVGSYRLPWYTLLDPDRFDFYWRLDEIITKFDSRVISNPQTGVWVIEAVPKISNPEDDYNYPEHGIRMEIFIDYNKGVIIKIDKYDMDNQQICSRRESQMFQLINNIWIPTKFILTKFPIPKFRPEQTTEEYTLSNIQLNTGIPDSEFEF